MHIIETGTFLGRVPFARIGNGRNPILVINGCQGFMMMPDRKRMSKDVRRLKRLLPDDRSFVLVGYDPSPWSWQCGGPRRMSALRKAANAEIRSKSDLVRDAIKRPPLVESSRTALSDRNAKANIHLVSVDVAVWPTGPSQTHCMPSRIRLGPSRAPHGTSWEMIGVHRASQPDIRHEHAARSNRGRHPKVPSTYL